MVTMRTAGLPYPDQAISGAGAAFVSCEVRRKHSVMNLGVCARQITINQLGGVSISWLCGA